MAFALSVAGDRWNAQNGNFVPRKPVSGYTTFAPGHLVKTSTAGNEQIDHVGNNDVLAGMLIVAQTGQSVLTMLDFRGCEVVFQMSGTVNRGDKVIGTGSAGTIAIGGILRDQVKTDNTNGTGTVIAVNEPATGLCTVRFP